MEDYLDKSAAKEKILGLQLAVLGAFYASSTPEQSGGVHQIKFMSDGFFRKMDDALMGIKPFIAEPNEKVLIQKSINLGKGIAVMAGKLVLTDRRIVFMPSTKSVNTGLAYGIVRGMGSTQIGADGFEIVRENFKDCIIKKGIMSSFEVVDKNDQKYNFKLNIFASIDDIKKAFLEFDR
ncbi:MAG: hypothetical protein WCK98_05895 [bacterium]